MSQPQPTPEKSLALQKIEKLQLSMNEEYVQNQLKIALGENTNSFAATLIDLFTGDSNLQACDPKQVILQAMKAAIMKLPINKSLGMAYIIAYNGKPEFQIGYKGLIQLALRTGNYEVINTDVIREGELRTVNKLTGEIDINGVATGDKVVGFFAHIELKNGFKKTFYMSTEKVRAHMTKFSKSHSNTSSPWQTNFDAMGKKTVLKYLLSHYGELSIDLANALEKDDEADKLQEEIKDNANIKNMSFSGIPEAEMVNDIPVNNTQNGQPVKAPF